MYIIYRGFLEIRIASLEESKSSCFFKVSDLLHNLPLQLDLEKNYSLVLDELKERAEIKGCSKWLINVINDFNEK